MRLTEELVKGPLGESWKVIAQYFGSDHTEITDNRIPTEDRVHFYRLEEAGYLESREEINYVFTMNEPDRPTKEWRTNYWRLKPNGHNGDHVHILPVPSVSIV